MKASISIPDTLWDCVKDTGDGPSAIVQEALKLLCDRRTDPLQNVPSASAKARHAEAIAEQARRLGSEVQSLREAGYEFGVALAAHLSYTELVSLPADVERAGRYLAYPFSEFLDRRAHQFLDPDNLEDLVSHPFGYLAIGSNQDFWETLYLAIERHVDTQAEGTDPNRSVHDLEADHWYPWQLTEAREGISLPEPSKAVGYHVVAEQTLPVPYAEGIAGALLDIRAAVAAQVGEDGFTPASEEES